MNKINGIIKETDNGFIVESLTNTDLSKYYNRNVNIVIDDSSVWMKERINDILNRYRVFDIGLAEATNLILNVFEVEKTLIELNPLKKVIIDESVDELAGFKGTVVGYGVLTPNGRLIKVRLENGKTVFVLETLLISEE